MVRSGTPGSEDDIGTIVTFVGPFGIATNATGNVYVADRDIRKTSLADAVYDTNASLSAYVTTTSLSGYVSKKVRRQSVV